MEITTPSVRGALAAHPAAGWRRVFFKGKSNGPGFVQKPCTTRKTSAKAVLILAALAEG
jgi:hypothetical protein